MIDYEVAVKCIRAKCRCTEDEAWSGLATAFLYLDTSRSDSEQFAYLVKCGCSFVRSEWQYQYVDKTSGVRKFVQSDFETLSVEPEVVPDDDFLRAFPEGLAREYAKYVSSGRTFSLQNCRNFLRKKFNVSNLSTPRRVYESVRICAKRLR